MCMDDAVKHSGFIICAVYQLSQLIKSRMIKLAGHAKETCIQYFTPSI
jgi:hypothetical protein